MMLQKKTEKLHYHSIYRRVVGFFSVICNLNDSCIMAKQRIPLGGIVFSTNPDYRPPEDDDTPEDAPALDKQPLRIWLQRIKGNKEATIIKGFEGSDDDLDDLAKLLKTKCATGGNAKDGEIILQGNHRDKVLQLLLDLGYSKTKKAGG
jgi:translation initiation factor 1